MARYPKEHSQQTRERILQTATYMFKMEGLDTVGIAKLMGKAGLTHGGFYAHFDSKDDLVEEALTAGLTDTMERLIQAAQQDGGGLKSVVRTYTSQAHRDSPETGCVLPSLAGEVARQADVVREPFTSTLEALVERLTGLSNQPDAEQRRAEVLVTLAAMVGAVALSRVVSDPALSDEILLSVRNDRMQQLQEVDEERTMPSKKMQTEE